MIARIHRVHQEECPAAAMVTSPRAQAKTNTVQNKQSIPKRSKNASEISLARVLGSNHSRSTPSLPWTAITVPAAMLPLLAILAPLPICRRLAIRRRTAMRPSAIRPRLAIRRRPAFRPSAILPRFVIHP